MALIVQAAQDYQDPEFWVRQSGVHWAAHIVTHPAQVRADALAFFNDPLYSALCEMLDLDPASIPSRLGLLEGVSGWTS